jgi:hypothetical protein
MMHFKQISLRCLMTGSILIGTVSLVSTLPALIGSLPAAYAQDNRERRVGSWNMQGSSAATENKWQSGVANLMQQQRYDVLALQEAGGVPDSVVNNPQTPANFRNDNWNNVPNNGGQFINNGVDVTLYNWLGTSTRPGYYIYYAQTDPNGNRVNLAIVTRRAADEVISFRPGCARRPVLGVRLGRVWYFTVHGRSGVRDNNRNVNDGPDIANGINAVVDYLGLNVPGDYNWIALGDWNHTPQGLIAAEPLGVGLRIEGGQATYPAVFPQRAYDYMVTDINFPRIRQRVLDLRLSDHAVSGFNFRFQR